MVASERRGAHANTAFHVFRTEVAAPGPGGDDGVNLQIVGTQTHAFCAVKTHRTHVGGFKLVFTHGGALRGVKLLKTPRNIHAQDFGRIEQAFGVLLQAKNGGALVGFVGAHALKYAHAVVQGVG